MSRDQQQQWVKHLDITQDAYVLELRQRDENQNLIIKYVVPVDDEVHSDLKSEHDEGIAKGQTMSALAPTDNSKREGYQSTWI